MVTEADDCAEREAALRMGHDAEARARAEISQVRGELESPCPFALKILHAAGVLQNTNRPVVTIVESAKNGEDYLQGANRHETS